MHRSNGLVFAITVCLLALSATAHASNACQWTGGGADGNWSTVGNWTNCGGGHPLNGDIVQFPNGAARPANQNDIATLSLANIDVIGTGAGNHHWDISGSAVRVTGVVSAQSPRDAGGVGPSFRAPIFVSGLGLNVQNNDAGAGGTGPFLLGDIVLGTLTITFTPTFPVVVGGTISGTGAIVKDATGDLTFNTNNAYVGPTTIKKGTLTVAANGALGATGAGNETTVMENGQLIVAANITLFEPLIVSGFGGVASTDGAISVATGVTAALAGAITLRPGFATFPYIAIGQNATLTISGPIDLTQGGTVLSSTLTKNGLGTLSFSNPANQFARLIINAGAVRVLPNTVGAIPVSSEVIVPLGGTFDLNNVDTTVGSVQGNLATNGGVIQLGSATLNVGGMLFGGTITGTGGLNLSNDNLLGGPAPNTFTGTTTINAGARVVVQKAAGVLTIPGPLVVNGELTTRSDEQIADTARVTINGAGKLTLQADTPTAATRFETIASLIGDGTLAFDKARLTVGGDNTSTTYSGILSGSGPVVGDNTALVKVGTGTLTLTNATFGNGVVGRLQAGVLMTNGNQITTLNLQGGTLGGVGTLVFGATMTGGTISPGASPGILHFSNQVTLSLGLLAIELNGPAPGSGYDQLDLSASSGANLTIGGTVALQVARGYGPPMGTAFTIVNVPAGKTVTGAFAGLPEGASIVVNSQRFGISYHGGDGNDVVLTALEDPPSFSINNVTVTEGDTGTTNATFTVTLSRELTTTATVQYATIDGTATSPQDYVAQSGTLTFAPHVTTQTITIAVKGDRNLEPDEAFGVLLSNAQGGATIGHAQGTGLIVNDDVTRTYYLSEGATGGFFDEDILIANPNDTTAPVTLTFSKENGEQVVATRSLPPQSHLTVHVDTIPGLEATSASAQVTSESGVPLAVERSMFWDASYYAGHTGSAVEEPAQDWFFAEGSQGFFQTFVLVINPNATPTDVTFTFLRESDTPVVKTLTVGPSTRLTLDAGSVPEIVNRSFGIAVHATQPIMAERSMYFGTTPTRLWSGGTESAGVTSASTHWFLAEGATGGFFDTFILLSNPQSSEAHVTLQYLLDTGETVTVPKTIAANARLTTNIEVEDDVRLHNAAVSTVVTSDVPIIAERSMYWPGAAVPWGEGHNSFGVIEAGVKWGLAEGRVGGALNFHTYILLANPQTTAAAVTVTFLRENGAPVVKTYTVPPTSRFNIDTSTVTELHDEAFGAVIDVTNAVPIIVERSMYWDSNGFVFSGGTNATGVLLPIPLQN